MGIDAEMLLRVRGERPTEQQLAVWSWNICRSIGARHFFIEDGIPPEEHHKREKKWHAAFNAHPWYGAWHSAKEPEPRSEARKHIIADIGELPKMRRRAIELTNTLYPLDDEECYGDIPPEYRQPGRSWTQDGDPILARPDEWFLEVRLWTRYYGIGYERGDLLTICAVAEWCELMIPNCEVWYGGDSSGICAAPFPDSERRKLKKHLFSPAGRDYFAYDAKMGRPRPHGPAPCALCVGGVGNFNEFGMGRNYSAVSCAGCGKSFESNDGGATWKEKEKEAA